MRGRSPRVPSTCAVGSQPRAPSKERAIVDPPERSPTLRSLYPNAGAPRLRRVAVPSMCSILFCAPLVAQDESAAAEPEGSTAPVATDEAEAEADVPRADATGGASVARDGELLLPDVVVRASQDDDALLRTPFRYGAGRTVLGPTRVRESGAHDVQDVLRSIPSVYVFEETGTDGKPNIQIRGVTSGSEGASRSANVSLMVDGIPLAPAPYGHAGQSLFPLAFERVYAVDVMRGGHTVRYGPNTVSGVVNYLTRPIPEQGFIEQRFHVDTYGDGSSYTAAGGTWGRLGVLGEAVYKGGSTYRDHGDYTIQNYALKTSFEFTDSFRGLFQVEYFDDDSDLAGGLSVADFQADPEQSKTPQDRFVGDQTRGNVKLQWDLDAHSRFEVIGYAFGGERTFYLGAPLQYGDAPTHIDATPRPMNVWAVQPQYSRTYDMADGRGEFVAGVRYHYEDITRSSIRYFADGTSTLRSDNRYDYHAWSAFLENTFEWDRFRLTPGVRLEYVDMDGTNRLTDVSVDRDFDEILPALSGSYLIEDDWTLYANVQSSFLPPQANQIEISDHPQNLDAQYAWTYEVGTRATMWDGAFNPDFTIYQIDYRGRVERDPDFDDVFVNRGNTQHRGAELAFDGFLGAVDAALEGWEWYGSLSYNDSEYESGEFAGNEVPHAPHWLASWGTVYRHADSGLWGGLSGYYAGSAFSDSANTVDIVANGTSGKRPAYSVWNARGGWDHELTDGLTLQLELGVNNVFDEEYFEVRTGKGLLLGLPRGAYSVIGLKASL